MIVDNENTCLETTKKILSSYKTITASNGEDGLRLLRANNDIFLIISGLETPRMDDFIFLEKSKIEFSEIPFYILLNEANNEIMSKLQGKGVDGYFHKPIKQENILSTIKTIQEIRLKQIEEEEEIFSLFFTDAQQNLNELDYIASTISTNPDSIKDIKRLLHTLKGSSSFVKKCDQISEVSHKTEDMIKIFVEKKQQLSPEATSALLEAIDYLREMLNGLKEDRNKRFDLTTINSKLLFKENTQTHESSEKLTEKKAEEKKSEGIFVQSTKLDALMEQAGNLIILRNLLNDHIASQSMHTNSNTGKLKDILQELDSISSHVHNEVSQMRKVPILSILKPYLRFIRVLSVATGKKLALQIFDNDIMIDKDAAKYLSDALVHLIRNSADHGIEEKEDRLKVNKKEEGSIAIIASENVDGIRVIVADDGRGINSKIILDKALKLGLVNDTHAKSMTESEKLELIFRSGFSTAQKLTQISGRGEGMDIVKDVLSKVKGRIKVETEIGKGTRFIVDIPNAKSVTIINSLIVLTQNNYFSMPTELVKKIIRLDGHHISVINSKKYIQDNERLLRLIYLEDLVDLTHFHGTNSSESTKSSHSIAIVFSQGTHHFGFVVDDIVQQLEIVYKRFDQYVQNLPAFKGTTLLKDGRPCLVLDLEWIIHHLTNDIENADEIIEKED